MAAKKQKAKAEQTAQPKAQKPKEEKLNWTKRLYIKGFGFVDVGDRASQEALAIFRKAVKGNTPPVNEDDYLTK